MKKTYTSADEWLKNNKQSPPKVSLWRKTQTNRKADGGRTFRRHPCRADGMPLCPCGKTSGLANNLLPLEAFSKVPVDACAWKSHVTLNMADWEAIQQEESAGATGTEEAR